MSVSISNNLYSSILFKLLKTGIIRVTLYTFGMCFNIVAKYSPKFNCKTHVDSVNPLYNAFINITAIMNEKRYKPINKSSAYYVYWHMISLLWCTSYYLYCSKDLKLLYTVINTSTTSDISQTADDERGILLQFTNNWITDIKADKH